MSKQTAWVYLSTVSVIVSVPSTWIMLFTGTPLASLIIGLGWGLICAIPLGVVPLIWAGLDHGLGHIAILSGIATGISTAVGSFTFSWLVFNQQNITLTIFMLGAMTSIAIAITLNFVLIKFVDIQAITGFSG